MPTPTSTATPPRSNTGAPVERRRCLRCRRQLPIEEFPIRHGYHVRRCWACRMVGEWVRRHDRRLEAIKYLARELIRAERKGRLRRPRTRRVFAALMKLCGGRPVDVARELGALLERERVLRPKNRLTVDLAAMPLWLGGILATPRERTRR